MTYSSLSSKLTTRALSASTQTHLRMLMFFLHRIGNLAGIGLVPEAQQHQAVRLAAGHRLADDRRVHPCPHCWRSARPGSRTRSRRSGRCPLSPCPSAPPAGSYRSRPPYRSARRPVQAGHFQSISGSGSTLNSGSISMPSSGVVAGAFRSGGGVGVASVVLLPQAVRVRAASRAAVRSVFS